MSWTTKEQKGEIAMMGLEAGLGLLQSWTEDTKRIKEKALEDNKIDEKELSQLLEINEEYTTKVNNLLYDTELGCKFKRTEEIFIMIVEIIMLDLENDYTEIIENFTKAIDTEKFIESHDTAIKLREERLDKEYQDDLNEYQAQLIEYQNKIKEQKSKGFFKRLLAEEISEPQKPERRN